MVLARTGVQLRRARDEVAAARARGVGEHDLRLLSAAEASARVGATGVLGGTFTPHCATVDPARLVRGLAEAVERRGVAIYEQTEAQAIRPGAVETKPGMVRAASVVRATEGYTRTLAGEERTLVPVYSLMIATEPLPDEFWSGAGLADRETFSDHRHLIIYGQRTEDDRLAFGGRGAPIPLRLGHPARVRPGRTGPRVAAPDADRAVPGPVRVRDHPPLGRPARHRPRLVPLGRARCRDRHRLGRRLRRRRGVDHQSGRTDTARSHPAA